MNFMRANVRAYKRAIVFCLSNGFGFNVEAIGATSDTQTRR